MSTTFPPPQPTSKLKDHRRKNSRPTTVPHRQEPNLFYDQDSETDEGHLASKSSREKWMLEAEVLRAECKVLRLEREFALKKLQENRVKMEISLRSAIQTLERKNITEGKNVKAASLDQEIEVLSAKLSHLQKSSSNDDTNLSVLTSEENLVPNEQTTDMSSMFSGSSSTLGLHQLSSNLYDGNKCTGRCKAMVRKILEQVRAETEQWSQMQEMLGKVRVEMEELQASRDYWENQARESDSSIQFLKKDVEAWKAKARDYKHAAKQLQLELSVLQKSIQRRKRDVRRLEKQKQHCKDQRVDVSMEERSGKTCKKDLAPLSLARQIANEKKMILRRLKEEGRNKSCERSPLRDIGNSSTLVRDRPAVCLSFRSVESCRMRESI